MVPLDDLWVHDVDIDWKNLVENYVEDYHFPMGHPGLSALMERTTTAKCSRAARCDFHITCAPNRATTGARAATPASCR
jgi:phenylpropionate dioxygenase-like ring-hydroxylating dioxygenase large terminal subunit